MRRVLSAGIAAILLSGCTVLNRTVPVQPPPREVSAQGFVLPVKGVVTSTYGNRRLGGVTRLHKGVDFAGSSYLTPVFAVAAGVVDVSAVSDSYGQWIQIRHPTGLYTRYAHLSWRHVSEGSRVDRGDLIGRVGASGRVTGPHLHFEVRRGGAPLDPLAYLPPVRVVGNRAHIPDMPPPPASEEVPAEDIVEPPAEPAPEPAPP